MDWHSLLPNLVTTRSLQCRVRAWRTGSLWICGLRDYYHHSRRSMWVSYCQQWWQHSIGWSDCAKWRGVLRIKGLQPTSQLGWTCSQWICKLWKVLFHSLDWGLRYVHWRLARGYLYRIRTILFEARAKSTLHQRGFGGLAGRNHACRLSAVIASSHSNHCQQKGVRTN